MRQLSLKGIVNLASYFGAANAINLTLPLILLPLLATAFTPADYRVLSIFQMLITLLSLFVGLQSITAVVRYVKNDDRDINSDQQVIGTSFKLYYQSIFILVICVFALQKQITEFLNIGFEILWLSLITASAMYIWQLYLNYNQAKERGRTFFFSTSLYALISIGFTILFLLIDLRINERVGAMLFCGCVMGVISWIKLRRVGKKITDRAIAKKVTSYSLNLVPHSVFVFLLAFADKIFVNTYFSEAVAGSYFLMFTVSQACLVIPAALNLAYRPWFYNNASNFETVGVLFQLTTIFWVASFVVVACAVSGVCAYLILLLLAETNSYEVNAFVFGVFCLLVVSDSFYLFGVNILLFLERAKTVSMITFASVVCTLTALAVLGPIFGTVGAASSCLVGSVVRMGLSFIIGIPAFRDYHLTRDASS